MARILISEPHEAVRGLLERMVTLLGHEPAVVITPTPEYLKGADVFVVEPAAMLGAVLAKGAHIADPQLPIVCVSVEGAPDIDVPFVAALVKPFTLAQFGGAIALALAARAKDGRHGAHDRRDHWAA